ncbi:protein of unknown function [Paraburkholderia kururiensis]
MRPGAAAASRPHGSLAAIARHSGSKRIELYRARSPDINAARTGARAPTMKGKIVTKEQLNQALDARSVARETALRERNAWQLTIGSHGSLIASLRANGHGRALPRL